MQLATAQPGKTRVGFIGTGVMGQSMCRHILTGGYRTTIFSRTKSKSQPLLDAGAAWADSPKAKGVAALDGPVSGGDVGAKNATLSIMVGGDAAALEAVRPILECMGKAIVHQGPAGAGQHTKMVNQILIASALNGVCEALLYAKKAGLDAKTVLQSVGGGAAASWQLNNLGPKMIDGNFEPGFYAEHFVKDMSIALSEARQIHLAMPGLALTAQLFNGLQAHGLGRKGTHALYLLLERLSNVKND